MSFFLVEKLEQPTSVNMFAIRVAPAETRRSASNVSLLVDSLPGAQLDHPIIIRKTGALVMGSWYLTDKLQLLTAI